MGNDQTDVLIVSESLPQPSREAPREVDQVPVRGRARLTDDGGAVIRFVFEYCIYDVRHIRLLDLLVLGSARTFQRRNQ